MKANEAPKKIYVSNYSSGLTYNWHNERLAVNDIEYIRKDAFIEKAQDFFRQSYHLFGLDGNELYHFIEDFRRYMEE